MAGTDFVTEAQLDALVTELASAITTLRSQVAFINAHGATAGTARNDSFAINIWIGTVDPTNATTDDIIVRTDLAVTP